MKLFSKTSKPEGLDTERLNQSTRTERRVEHTLTREEAVEQADRLHELAVLSLFLHSAGTLEEMLSLFLERAPRVTGAIVSYPLLLDRRREVLTASQLSSVDDPGLEQASIAANENMADLEFRPNPRLFSRTGSYVLSGYAGGYAFDRKSNSLVLGGRLGYYVFDRIQAEAGLAWTHINRPAEIVESLFGLTLEAEKFHMLFYSLNLTWEILPGRQMVPFVTAGAGSAIMQGETEPAFNFGAGTQLFLSKRTSMRWEVRDYRFSTGNGTSRVSNDNIEFTLGTSYLF